jgi:hypothetical protein
VKLGIEVKRLFLLALALGVFAGGAGATMAGKNDSSTGNGAPSGAHYSLNIIGASKEKVAAMTGSNRHVIFVPLSGSTKINLAQGSFAVLDGNGTDGSATFQLPAPDPDGDGWTEYSVFARALGKPKGSAKMTSCVSDATGNWCSTEQVLLVRSSGNSKFANVSKQLLTVCIDTDFNGSCDRRVALFSDAAFQYFWQYDNSGLKLAQLRFYEVPAEVGTTP